MIFSLIYIWYLTELIYELNGYSQSLARFGT